jgi:GDSL-like Lipase/Acylhydrolase family
MIRFKPLLQRRSDNPWRQELFPFLVAAARRERFFRRAILGLTLVLGIALVMAFPAGRTAVRLGLIRIVMLPREWLSAPDSRTAREDRITRERIVGCDDTRRVLRGLVRESPKPMQDLLRLSELDADTAIVRWANFDRAFAFSSGVFEADDQGRSYRLRPLVRSIWVLGLSLRVTTMFEVPDTPKIREAARLAGGQVVVESVQNTNSWGCRGPEPRPLAEIRGLVLGDSCMQGTLIGDLETPPARLEARLEAALHAPVCVLNTGVVGYSLEQEYATLLEYGDRFKPHFVIISICSNDFGDMKNKANWDEGEYWLDEITQYCRTRQLLYFVVPFPNQDELLGRRDYSIFPGQVSRILKGAGMNYVDPIEEFTNEQIRLRIETEVAGRKFSTSPLYNGHLQGDRHFSALGSDLWARVVAERLLLAWSARSLVRLKVPEPIKKYTSEAHTR